MSSIDNVRSIEQMSRVTIQDALATRPELSSRIIEAALEQFGRMGFDGASTREIARASGTAMSSITYHFGSKHGLYLACADHIATTVSALYVPQMEAIHANPPQVAEEARNRLLDLLEVLARLMLSPRSATFSQFIAREQQYPTEAFERIYERMMRPLLDCALALMAIARPTLAEREQRALVTNLMGMALVLRLGRACVMRTIQVDDLDDATADFLVTGLRRSARTLLTET